MCNRIKYTEEKKCIDHVTILVIMPGSIVMPTQGSSIAATGLFVLANHLPAAAGSGWWVVCGAAAHTSQFVVGVRISVASLAPTRSSIEPFPR